MERRLFLCLASAAYALLGPAHSTAWGPLGHATIGNAAVQQLNAAERGQLMEILSVKSDDELSKAVSEACFWPDTVRDSPEWSWSAPLHYVNIPRSSDRYDRQRDCRDGICVTEGVLKYAAELGRPGLDRERRRQAFSWICHLVADLHQPLHAGFRDDRGGNRVDIVYHGEQSNLHRFWDSLLVRERLPDERSRRQAIEAASDHPVESRWNPSDVAHWTNESHTLAAERAYPATGVIDAAFENASWTIIQRQWRRAAGRLSAVLREVLPADPAQAAEAD
jgi:hypothetical protein